MSRDQRSVDSDRLGEIDGSAVGEDESGSPVIRILGRWTFSFPRRNGRSQALFVHSDTLSGDLFAVQGN